MTDYTAQPATPVENVGRGTTFALLAIPIAMIAFSLIAGLFGIITGIVAIAVPFVSSWLYTKGAGAPLTRAGWGPFIGVTAAAVIIGTFTGIVASSWFAFNRVGGDGGFFSGAFWTTVRNQFTIGLGDNALAILIGLGLGAAGIYNVIRGPRAGTRRGLFGGSGTQQNMPGSLSTPGDPTVPPAPPVPPTQAPAPPPAPNQPSSGVILNGKPVEPEK